MHDFDGCCCHTLYNKKMYLHLLYVAFCAHEVQVAVRVIVLFEKNKKMYLSRNHGSVQSCEHVVFLAWSATEGGKHNDRRERRVRPRAAASVEVGGVGRTSKSGAPSTIESTSTNS